MNDDTMPDVLSRVAQAFSLGGSTYYRIEASDPLGMAIPAKERHVCFHIVLSGTAHLQVDGHAPVVAHEMDVVLINGNYPHQLRDHPSREVVHVDRVKERAGFVPGETLRIGSGEPSLVMLCGVYTLADRFNPLLDSLPRAMHMPARQAGTVTQTLGIVDVESHNMRQGSAHIVDRLSEIVLLQVVREWLEREQDVPGFLMAYQDVRVGRAVTEVQAHPEQPWTVATLAAAAGMSRTAFALRFRELMEVAPMAFVTEWRMQRSRVLLRKPELGLAEVGAAVGYSSQSAFAKAFRKHYGAPPGEVRTELLRG